jgi:hypothetical protein
MATYIMGDIQRLLEAVRFDPALDRLITVGDIIGRGPREAEVVTFFMRHGHLSLLGNHERRLLDLKPEDPAPAWMQAVPYSRAEIMQWLRDRPRFYETDDYLVVHAGLHPDGRHPRDTDPALLTRIRTWDGKGEALDNPENPAWFEFYRGKKMVFFGHWAARGLYRQPLIQCLDSGCVYGGSLTCCLAETGELYSVKAARTYRPPNRVGHPWKFERRPAPAGD